MELFTEPKEAERLLEKVAETPSDIIYMFSADWEEIIFVNSAYEDIWGRDIATLEQDSTDFLNGIHPDDRGAVKEAMEKVSNGEIVEIEFRVNADEDYKRWVRARSEPVYDNEGHISRIAGFVLDITEWKQYERKLKLERDRFQALFENLGEPVVEVVFEDGDPIIERFNDAFEDEFGLGEEAVGKCLDDLIVPEDDEVSYEINKRAHEGEPVEFEVMRGRDKLKPYLFRSAPFTGPEGKQYGHGIYTDISYIKEYEKELEEQRDGLEMVNRLFNHDIRNDMQMVIGMSQMLEDHIDEEGKKYLEGVMSSAESTIDLINTVENLTEVMLEQDFGLEQFSLRKAIQSQVEKIRSRYNQATVRVEDVPSEQVKADQLLESVIYNILQNAVKHNDKERPEVTVSAERQDDYIILRIEDNGPGIPDDSKEKVFEKGKSMDEGSGTGVGLYLASMHVKRYEGDIWIEDNDPEGSVFNIKLPMADEN